jgi:imidazolonepropionase-like amidohydrolase
VASGRQRRGHVAPSFDADLVILSSDAARDSTAFAKVVAAIRAGKLIQPAAP